jgi:hypothetical protein
MKTAIALLTLASFGATFVAAQTPDTTGTAKTKKASKKKHSKKKGAAADSSTAAPTK